MSGCEAFRDRLLDGEDAAAMEHVRGCAACAAEVASLNEALNAVALAAPSAAERLPLASLSHSTLSAWRRGEQRRSSRQRVLTLGLVAAAAALMLLLPTALRRQAVPQQEVGMGEQVDSEVTDPAELTGVAFAGEGFDEWSDDSSDEAAFSDVDGVDL